MRADSGDEPFEEPDELTATADAPGPVVATGVLVGGGGFSLAGAGLTSEDGAGFAADGSAIALGGVTGSGGRLDEAEGGGAVGGLGEASARRRSAKLGFSGRGAG